MKDISPNRETNLWTEEERSLPTSFMPTKEVVDDDQEWERYHFMDAEVQDLGLPPRVTPPPSVPVPSMPPSPKQKVIKQEVDERVPVHKSPMSEAPAQIQVQVPTPQHEHVDVEEKEHEVPTSIPEEVEPEMVTPTPEPTTNTRYSLRGGPAVNYFPDPQKYRAHVHLCNDKCADKYLSTLLLMGRVQETTITSERMATPIEPANPMTKPPSVPAPRNRKEALASAWWEGYHLAELEEMKSHAKNGTWILIPPEQVPEGKTILKDRWAYADKLSPDGKNIERFKARLTAMGCFQKPGADYNETYASVMTNRSFRMLLHIYNSRSIPCCIGMLAPRLSMRHSTRRCICGKLADMKLTAKKNGYTD